MFTFDLLDEMMPIFKATFSEARFFPCPYEGGGVHRVIGCFFKVPRCFKASLAKELAQTACKCALASAGKSFDKKQFPRYEFGICVRRFSVRDIDLEQRLGAQRGLILPIYASPYWDGLDRRRNS